MLKGCVLVLVLVCVAALPSKIAPPVKAAKMAPAKVASSKGGVAKVAPSVKTIKASPLVVKASTSTTSVVKETKVKPMSLVKSGETPVVPANSTQFATTDSRSAPPPEAPGTTDAKKESNSLPIPSTSNNAEPAAAPAPAQPDDVPPAPAPLAAESTISLEQDTELPSVSVCVPCIKRDMGINLDRLLASTAVQSHPAKEVIVALSGVSNKESDELRAHLTTTFPNLPITILPTEDTMTAGVNRNRAAEHSTGDLISFMDADDEMHPQTLEAVAGVAKTTNAKCVLHTYVAGKAKVEETRAQHLDWKSAVVVDGDKINKDTLQRFGTPATDQGEYEGLVAHPVVIHHGHPTCTHQVMSEVKQQDWPRGQDVQFLRSVFHTYGPKPDTMVAVDLPLTFYYPSSESKTENVMWSDCDDCLMMKSK